MATYLRIQYASSLIFSPLLLLSLEPNWDMLNGRLN